MEKMKATRDPATTDRTSQTMRLPNGRTLGYAEYGDAHGEPLLYFHGLPGSRLEASDLDGIASHLKIRILAIDRPGFGLSTHDPNRRIGDWPSDVAAFTESLNLSRFAVLGVSGGGPFALACAKDLPATKLSAVASVAGTPMWDRGVRTEGFPWFTKLGYLGGKYWPSGAKVIIRGALKVARPILETAWAKRVAESGLQEELEIRKAMGPGIQDRSDLKIASTTAIANMCEGPYGEHGLNPRPVAQIRKQLVQDMHRGSFAQGTAGFVREMQLLTQEWDFRYEDVAYSTVQIWQGINDENVSPTGVRIMAERLPHCVLTETDDTHHTIGRAYEQILTQIMSFRDEAVVVEGAAT